MSVLDQHSPGFSYVSLVQEIRTSLSVSEIAAVTGVKERQVQHWAAGSSRPRDETRDRLVDVHYLVRQLAEVYRPEGIEIWLHARNRELDGSRPIDLLVAGDFEPVVHAVERLKSGAMG
jgi:transcriptional regulator with XRE-family HTH domain